MVSLDSQQYLIDLVALSLQSLDVIIGIDWMSRVGAVIDCKAKTVSLPGPSEQDDRVVVAATRGNSFTEKFLAYLEYEDAQPCEMELIASMPVVAEFAHVFQDIPGLPPTRCIDFEIKFHPGTTPISRVPYRMAPAEMK